MFVSTACQNGTYASENAYGDSTSVCIPCPDVNHITVKIPAISVNDCVCASGFTTDGLKCEGNAVYACVRVINLDYFQSITVNL